MNAPSKPLLRRRRWRVAAATLIAAALVAAGALAWLLRSEGGSAWLLARVPGLTVTGATGRLAGGPFTAESLEYRIGARTLTVQGLAWQDAVWSWRPYTGAWIGLTLHEPRIAQATIASTPSAGAPVAQPRTAPTTLRLPLALTLQGARVATLRIETLAPLTDIRIDASLGARDGAVHRVDELAFDWDRASVHASGSLASDAPFDLDLQTELRSRVGREGTAAPWQARATARGPLAALALQAQLGSAPGATLKVDANVQPFAAWPLASLAATTQDLDLASLASGLPTTRLTGRADIDTRGLDAPVAARIGLLNSQPGRWDQQRLPIAGLDLEVGAQPRERSRLTVQRFALQLAAGAGLVEGSGDWQRGSAQLTLRLRNLRPALLDARAPAMTLAGTATLQASGLPWPDASTAAAASQSLQARLDLDGALDTRSALPVHVSARAEAERSGTAWRVEFQQVQARSGDARAEASLAARRDADGAVSLRSRGELAGVDPALWFPGLGAEAHALAWRRGPNRLAGTWRADLQTAMPAAPTGDPVAQALAWRGEVELDLRESLLAGVPLQGHVKLDGRDPGWGVSAELGAAANHAALQGRLMPRDDDDRWQIDLDAPALAALRPLVGLHPIGAGLHAAGSGASGAALTGQVSGQLQARGRWPALSFSADLHASALQIGPWRAARVQAQLQAGPDARSALAAQVDLEQAGIDAWSVDTLRLRLDGSLAEHRLTLDLQSPLRPPAWTDPWLGGGASGSQLSLRAQGRWQNPEARDAWLPGRWLVQDLEVEARGRSTAANGAAWLRARDLALQLQFDEQGHVQAASAEPGRIEALGAALRWTALQWRAGSATAPAQAALDAQLEPLLIAPWLTRLHPAAGLGGDLTLTGHARVTVGANVAADVVLERSSGDLSLTDDTGTQPFGLSDLRLGLAAHDGIWHFTQALAGSNLGALAGAQSLRLPPQATWPRSDTAMQGVLEWQIADLGAWAPFTPAGWHLAGRLHTGAALGGTFGAPEVTGTLSGQRLAVRNLLQGVDVRDGELALSLRGDQATIDRFVFKGGAGELRLTGAASLGAEPSAKLELEAERFQLLGRVDRRIVTSGSATLKLLPRSLDLDGHFRVDEGLFDFSHADAPSLDSDIQVRGGRTPTTPIEATDTAAGGGAAQRAARVALQVDLGDQLKVRGRGLDTRLRGELALSTPGGRLSVNGSVRAEAGSYAAYGQKLAIERGQLLFNGPADNPRLDILALRPNLDQRVGVLVSGSAKLPRVRLYSDPEMSETDTLSWLVLGRAPDGLARADTALLQHAALALLAGEGQSPDQALLANIGLDELSVRQTESGDVKDTVVTVGKQLSRHWYVGYERGINATTGTWQLIYRIAQRLTLRAQAGEDNALDAIWTWRWN
jgi:translocation and assembly module TamB